MSAQLFPYRPEGLAVPEGYTHPKAEDYRAYLSFMDAKISRRDPISWTLPHPPAEIYRVAYGVRVADMSVNLGKSISSTTTLLRGMRFPSPIEIRLLQDLTKGLLSTTLWDAWGSSDHSPSSVFSRAQIADTKPVFSKLHRVHRDSETLKRGRPRNPLRVVDPYRVRSVSLPESMYNFMKGLSTDADKSLSVSHLVRTALLPYLVDLGYECPSEMPEEELLALSENSLREEEVLQASPDTKRNLLDTSALTETPLESNVDPGPSTVNIPEPPASIFSSVESRLSEEVPAPTIFPHNYTNRPPSKRYTLPEECDLEYDEHEHIVFRKSFTDPGWKQDRNLSPTYVLEDGRFVTVTEEGVERMHFVDGSSITSEDAADLAVRSKKAHVKKETAPSHMSAVVLEQQRVLDEEYARLQGIKPASEDFDTENSFPDNPFDPSIEDPEYVKLIDRARESLLRGDDSYDVLDRLCCAGVELEDIAKLYKSLSMEVPE
jgi:hypothetical protein